MNNVITSLFVGLRSGAASNVPSRKREASAPEFAPLHRAQLLMYLKLVHKEVGLLFNVDAAYLSEGNCE